MTESMRGRRILLGITGGIAAYKTADLASKLVQASADVEVIMTENATRFIAPLTFESLVHKNVHVGLWQEHEKQPGHIALSEWGELMIVAPATANCIAKLAHGLADDLLACTLLATRAPILMAPAMNDQMYSHPATQANLALLSERGVAFVGPDEGRLASGKIGGKGRMASPATIFDAVSRLFG